VADESTEMPVADMPPGVALAWGLREKKSRGPKPALTLDDIVGKTIEVADAEGLGAVSMSRIAGELGYTTMSLYRYVESKEELLFLAMDAATGPETGDPLPPGSWRERLEHWSVQQLVQLRRHPWFTRISLPMPPLGPNSLAWVDQGLSTMEGLPLSSAEKFDVIGILSMLALQEVRMWEDEQAAHRAGGPDPIQVWGALAARFADPARLPHLAAALATAGNDNRDAPDPTNPQAPASFLFGVRRLFDGVELMLQRRPATYDPATHDPAAR
jgi:AcrR family transcriptional regulator